MLLPRSFQKLSELGLLLGDLETGSRYGAQTVRCSLATVPSGGSEAGGPDLVRPLQPSGLIPVTSLLCYASVFCLSTGTIISIWPTLVGCCKGSKLG